MILVTTLLNLAATKQHFAKTKLPKAFNYVCIDSRKANENDIFIAIKGENNDAHNYLTDVFNKGTKLAIVNESWYASTPNISKNWNLLVVKDTTLALGELAYLHRQSLAVKVIAIGGSNGKTSTKEMLYAILATTYTTLKTEGNFNNHIGVPLTLLRLKKEHEYAVIEVGCNHFDEITYLCRIANPDYGVITNIGKEHLEFFKNKAGVAKAELELFDYLKNKKGSICFVNANDSYLASYATKFLKANQVRHYGIEKKTFFSGKFLGYNKQFNPFIELTVNNKEVLTTFVNSFGKPGALNGVAVASIAHTLGVSRVNIADALSHFTSESSKRMETIKHKNHLFINDCYNSNPDSVKLGLETLADYNTNKNNKFIVMGDMLELGKVSEAEHEQIGVLIDQLGLDNVFLYGPLSLYTYKKIKKAKRKFHFTNKNELNKKLESLMTPEAIVYVKGSRGMKMEDVTNYMLAK